ncbi:putative protein tma23 [Phaeomoniella chlamydospora]|uniref:Uncharacterized protein n=1 Tax=Phaeomoniella chlamydospora TaxID=158046 RepID=A0A0G2E9W2_PHACM|nr:putative protein tma23 [Phaeomoniella chlamydospora]
MSLGWAGPGHALNSHLKSHKGRGGLGLTKPLLVSQKKNTFGIGKKSHEPPSGTEWWLKGFEKALQGVGTDGSKSASAATSGTATPTGLSASGYVGKHSGLYTNFVKGEQMKGTIEEWTASRKVLADTPVAQEELPESTKVKRDKKSRSSKKRKSEVLDTDESPSCKSAITSKKSKQTKDQNKTEDFDHVNQFLSIIDKDKKRRKRAEKYSLGTEFQHITTYLGERDEVDPALKKRKKKKNTGKPSESEEHRREAVILEDDSEAAKRERRRRQRNEERTRRKELQEQREQHIEDSRITPKPGAMQWSSLITQLNGSAEANKLTVPTSPEKDNDEPSQPTRESHESLTKRIEKEERRRLRALRKQSKEERKRSKASKKSGQGNTDDGLMNEQTGDGEDGTVNALLAWDRAVRT